MIFSNGWSALDGLWANQVALGHPPDHIAQVDPFIQIAIGEHLRPLDMPFTFKSTGNNDRDTKYVRGAVQVKML